MSQRLSYFDVDPEGLAPMLALEAHIRRSGLDHTIVELVKMRASQLNGCAYCLDMHSKDALAAGETAQRLHVLPAWREAPFYTERERAALAWTEALTHLPSGGVPDELYESVRAHFEEKEMVVLTLVIVAINSWNRLAIGFGADVGSYQPTVKA